MRILADENMDAEVIRWLRARGHDVLWAAEELGGAADSLVLSRAFAEDRLVLTHDLDFGELAIHHRLRAKGVILLRFKSSRAGEIVSRLAENWAEIERRAAGRLTVVSDIRIRVRPLPSTS
jgi:predicted nuclease of predicted toxin-antitoxin system